MSSAFILGPASKVVNYKRWFGAWLKSVVSSCGN
jgi:hypothetical protein